VVAEIEKENCMSQAIVIRGHYAGRSFVPMEPLPEAEGTAELIIIPVSEKKRISIFDLFGKAPRLRTASEIAAQVQEEHDAWDEP
jgi:hypothetical protein